MGRLLTLLTGFGMGATAAYLLDVENGRYRRARLHDQLLKAGFESVDDVADLAVDFLHRTKGVVHHVGTWSEQGRIPSSLPNLHTQEIISTPFAKKVPNLIMGLAGAGLLVASLRTRGLKRNALRFAGFTLISQLTRPSQEPLA